MIPSFMQISFILYILLPNSTNTSLLCPNYWWMNEGVCDVDRCSCHWEDKNCCLFSPNWNVTYDEDRRRISSLKCVESFGPQMVNPSVSTNYSFQIGISGQPGRSKYTAPIYPCKMNIFWRLEWPSRIYRSPSRLHRNHNINTTVSDVISAAGMSIDKTSGWLTVWGSDDYENATVQFTVKPLACDCNATKLVDEGQTCELVIVNATSECQSDCFDGRIYPLRIAIYFYTQCCDTSTGSTESTESTIPTNTTKLRSHIVIFIVGASVLIIIGVGYFIFSVFFKSAKTNDIKDFFKLNVEGGESEGETIP